jgi:alpha-N-arabinofuranosidase
VAVTELQLFATLLPPKGDAPARLTRENMVSPDTLAEALYDVLVYHGAVRLAPLVEMVTQSATVNHGGGLRKERERVFPNPCHYAQKMFACFNGATPVTVTLECGREKLPRVMPDSVRSKVPMDELPVLDAVAAIGGDGELLISVVHRGVKGPVELTIDLEGVRPTGAAQVQTLTAEVPWAKNTLAEPEAVVPKTSTAEVKGSALTLTVPRYSVTVIRLPSA